MFGNNNPQRARDSAAVIDAIAVAMIETLGAKRRATRTAAKRKNSLCGFAARSPCSSHRTAFETQNSYNRLSNFCLRPPVSRPAEELL